MQLTLSRTYQQNQTIGKLKGDRIDFCTMELVWNDNKTRQSCIPEGTYKVSPRISSKYGKHFILNNVPGRDAILIHTCNYSRELLGCIGIGLSHKDIDGDGNLDITSSKLAMETLLFRYPTGFDLVIKKA